MKSLRFVSSSSVHNFGVRSFAVRSFIFGFPVLMFASAVLMLVLVSCSVPAEAQTNAAVRFNPSARGHSSIEVPSFIGVSNSEEQAAEAAGALVAGQGPEGSPRIATYGSGGASADSVAVADVNGDGIPDVVVANACQGGLSKFLSCTNSAADVSVLLGRGDGTFQPAVSYDAGGYSYPLIEGGSWVSVAIADVNGDGHPDLIVATQCQTEACTNSGVSVLLGNGDGTFQPAVSYDTGGVGFDGYYTNVGGQWVAVGDLRGDGKQDLIVASPCHDESCGNDGVSVLLGNGDGTFQPAVAYSAGGLDANSVSVAVADVNGDGKLDAIVVNACGSPPPGCSDGSVSVLLGNGDGTLQAPVSYSTGYPDSTGIAIGDLNGDGKLDLVVGSEAFVWCFYQCGPQEAPVSVLLGNGDGSFQPAVTFGTGGFFAASVAIADMNGDGKADLVVAQQCTWLIGDCTLGPGQAAVLLGNGDGTFKDPVLYGTGGLNAESVALLDVNGDGRPDWVVANQCALRGKGSCTSGGVVGVMLNNFIASTVTTVVGVPNPAVVNESVTFTATISSTVPVPDGDGVVFYNGKARIGTGTTKNGVASLTASFAKTGQYTIKASYPGDAFHKGSFGIDQELVTKGAEAETATANESGRSKPQPLDASKQCGTSTYLATSGSPSMITDSVTFTAQAIANSWCHGEQITCNEGQVSFYDDKTLMGSMPVQNCMAALATDSLTVGNHRIVATFNTGLGWHESSAHLTQVVNKWPTTTALSSTPDPSSKGESVTFTAAVVSSWGGLPLTGSVKFMNGGRKIGIAPVDENGVATLITAKLPVGTDAITAEYLGDTYDAVSMSAVLEQVVQP